MESNPYKPPETEVGDVDEPRPPAERPFNATLGVRLLWVYLLAGLPGTFDLFGSRVMTSPRDQTQDLFIALVQGIAIVSYAVNVWLNIMCWKGRNWARITHLVLLSIALMASVFTYSWTLKGPAYQVTVYLLQTALNVAGEALLFTPSASAWYRNMRRR